MFRWFSLTYLSGRSNKGGDSQLPFILQDTGASSAAPVPKSRMNLTRFHSVFVPNRYYYVLVIRTKQSKGEFAVFMRA